MATRNNSIMAEFDEYRIYDRNGKQFVSELSNDKLRRLRIDKNLAALLVAVPSKDRCRQMIDEAEKIGSPNYYATTIRTTH